MVIDMKRFFLLFLFITSCVTLRTPNQVQDVTLTKIPTPQTDYTYHIKLVPSVREVAIFWYYRNESIANSIYRSGVVQIKHGIIETQMYFPWEGDYILVILTQTSDRRTHQIHKFRYKVRF